MTHTLWNTPATQERLRLQPWALPQPGPAWPTNPSRLDSLLRGFDPISLADMNAVALLNRTDTKFVMPTGQLLHTLAALQSDYRVLCMRGQRLHHYRTLYFDTPDFALYHLHVNKRPNLYKVRSREYTDTHESFLEVKHKTHKERTIKERIPTAQPMVELTTESVDWLNGVYPYDCQVLEPKLWNTFTRITLVSRHCCERVTLDVELAFYADHQQVQMDHLAIAELKADACSPASPFLAQMRTQRIRPIGFSKYCIGTSLLFDQVKKNALKPKMLRLEKMMKGSTCND